MTNTKAIVTHTKFDRSVRPGKCKVYVGNDNKLDKLLEDWANKNNIYSLTFKSRAWTWLSNQRHKLFCKLIGKALGCGSDNVKFSHKAGCSCGCSPGFNVTLPQAALQYTRSNVWADIVVDEDELSCDFDYLRQMADAKLMEDKQREINKGA